MITPQLLDSTQIGTSPKSLYVNSRSQLRMVMVATRCYVQAHEGMGGVACDGGWGVGRHGHGS